LAVKSVFEGTRVLRRRSGELDSVTCDRPIVGTNHVIGFPSKARPICIPFKSPWGSLCLEVSLMEQEEPVVNREPVAVA